MVTLVFLVFVCGLSAQPASVTGLTSLSAADLMQCSVDTIYSTSIAVWPAPLFLPELSRALCLVPVAEMAVGLMGGSGAGWTDVSGIVQRCWSVTPSFGVGAVGLLGWKGAVGFAPLYEASINVQVKAAITELWHIGMGVDAMLYYGRGNGVPPRLLRVGLGYVSSSQITIDVEAGETATCIMLSTSFNVTGWISSRIALRSNPLSLGITTRILSASALPVIVGAELIMSAGLRTVVAVEL